LFLERNSLHAFFCSEAIASMLTLCTDGQNWAELDAYERRTGDDDPNEVAHSAGFFEILFCQIDMRHSGHPNPRPMLYKAAYSGAVRKTCNLADMRVTLPVQAFYNQPARE
jgi:hypothetical protein